MRFGVLKLFLLFLLLPLLAFSYDIWEPIYELDQFEMNNETFGVVAIQKRNVREIIQALPPEQRLRKQTQLWENRAETNIVLDLAASVIGHVYHRRGVFHTHTGEGLRSGLDDVRKGKYPIILITKYNDPFEIYQVVTVGPDFGDGIPAELRLVPEGMEPLPRGEIRPAQFKIEYISRFGKLFVNRPISDFVSLIPHWTGGVLEVKTFAATEESPYDFSSVLHRLVVSRNYSLWSRIPVPYALPPLEGALLDQAHRLKELYPDTPDELLFPEKQQYVINEWIYAQSVRKAAVKLFQRDFAFSAPIRQGEDPHNPGREYFLSPITRRGFEVDTPARLQLREDFNLVVDGKVAANDLRLLDCSRSLDVNYYQSRGSVRQGWDIGGWRLIDGKRYVVPRNSYLNAPKEVILANTGS